MVKYLSLGELQKIAESQHKLTPEENEYAEVMACHFNNAMLGDIKLKVLKNYCDKTCMYIEDGLMRISAMIKAGFSKDIEVECAVREIKI